MKVGIFSGGKDFGLGHLKRCQGLVTVLRGNGHLVFWNEDDTAPLTLANKMGIELDWFLVDHPHGETILDAQNVRARKRAFLHGSSDLSLPKDPDRWDLIIVQGVLKPQHRDEKWVGGPDFALIRPEIATLGQVVKEVPAPGDGSIFFYPLRWRELKPKGWHISQYMWAHAAVVSFGMVSLELAVLRVPQIIVYEEEPKPTAAWLAELGSAKLLKRSDANPETVERMLSRPFFFRASYPAMGCWKLMLELEERL